MLMSWPSAFCTVRSTGRRSAWLTCDTPYPSALLLAFAGSRPLHVVRAIDTESQTTYVITAYEPDPAEWDASFRIRRTP